MGIACAFLFEGPCDGEVMDTADNATSIEISVMDKKETHIYIIYSVNELAGMKCRIYKFKETTPDD